MLFILIPIGTFILLLIPHMNKQWRFLVSLNVLFYSFQRCKIAISFLFQVPKMNLASKTGNEEQEDKLTSLLDLPELALYSIFERLSPTGLCSMAGVCSYMKERCISDHLWEKHMKLKWGRVIGDAAYKEWQWHVASRWKGSRVSDRKGLFDLSRIWPLAWIKLEADGKRKAMGNLPVDSIMALYVSLEQGKFWFPAQVYNRENGHVGFMLSCYDAQVCYDHHTNSFKARYSPHGRRTIEENIQWDRLRIAPVDNLPHVLHASDCLHDLRPGDHVEIQWRRNEEFPYGWWYAVVGHLESCRRNLNYCHCHQNDIIMLEFNQFNPESRWRRTTVNRKDHREEGNEIDGSYGGIRKLYKEDEILMWKKLWPTKVLE